MRTDVENSRRHHDQQSFHTASGQSCLSLWRLECPVLAHRGKGLRKRWEIGYRTTFVSRTRLDSTAGVRAVRCLPGLLVSSNCIPAVGGNAGFRKSRQTGNLHHRTKETAIPARLERHAHVPTRPTVQKWKHRPSKNSSRPTSRATFFQVAGMRKSLAALSAPIADASLSDNCARIFCVTAIQSGSPLASSTTGQSLPQTMRSDPKTSSTWST